jgi:hypothetical protein
VVGFGAEEKDQQTELQGGEEEEESSSSYGEVSKLTFLPPSPKMAAASSMGDDLISDILLNGVEHGAEISFLFVFRLCLSLLSMC